MIRGGSTVGHDPVPMYAGAKIGVRSAGKGKSVLRRSSEDKKGVSTAGKITIGALISFVATKVIWAFLIGRRKWRGRKGRDPDRVDRFVDWCWKWSIFVPKLIYRKLLKPLFSRSSKEEVVTEQPEEVARADRVEVPQLSSTTVCDGRVRELRVEEPAAVRIPPMRVVGVFTPQKFRIRR